MSHCRGRPVKAARCGESRYRSSYSCLSDLAQFDGTADEDLLQFPLFADFGGNGQGTAGLLHVAGHVLMGRAGQGRGDGCRSAAAAVFPI